MFSMPCSLIEESNHFSSRPITSSISWFILPFEIIGNLGVADCISIMVSLPLVSIIADFTSFVEKSPSIRICSISWSADIPTLAQFSTFTLPFFIRITGFPTTNDFTALILTSNFTIITTKDQTKIKIRNVKMEMEVL